MKRIRQFVTKHLKRKKSPLKQEVLFRMALVEHGIDHENADVKIDHINGKCTINKVNFGIIYPRSFFEKAFRLMENKKEYKYYFNGFCDTAGGREQLLAPFQRTEAKIIFSNDGRDSEKKRIFNTEYFEGLSKSEFGLCPHQLNWKGNKETMWTYRFIECCMVGSIPIVFNQTPLSEEFTSDIVFYMDDEMLTKDIKYCNEEAKKNYIVSREKHTLSDKDATLIKSTI